jgi:hypothetical protein
MLITMLILIFGIVWSFLRSLRYKDKSYGEYKNELSLNFYLYKLMFWVPAAVLGAIVLRLVF